MESTNVREINEAIWDQAMRGRRKVSTAEGRVYKCRKSQGQLQVKLLNGPDEWRNVTSVTIT